MIPTNRTPTHPGEILRDEFLGELGVPQTELAAKLGIPVQRINEIVNGKRGITPDTAWLFSGALGTTPEFWMNLQAAYDLARNRPEKSVPKLVARSADAGTAQARKGPRSRRSTAA
jgi:addiction module HigA family antidote